MNVIMTWKLLIVLIATLCFISGNAEDAVTNFIDYTHEGDELQAYVAVPATASNENKVPAIVIVPDWDGMNEYERLRARMIAEELGYVGFAADIYGKDLHFVEDFSQRIQLATLYRSNATLFAHRIQAAIDTVRTLPEVDTDNVAIIGYCFGGTGVLIYGLEGVNDVKGIVSFHGGLTSIPDAGPAIEPKILVLSGGDDDTSTDIMDLEITLDEANATWEITRYSGIEHAFTVFDDDRYNQWADMRSWESMKEFLKECFGEITYESNPPSMTMVEPVDYTDVDGKELRGYLSLPSSEWMRPLPAVMILPDWDGVNEYEQQRATLLAEYGYVGFAADIYGADLQNDLSFDVRRQQAGLYRSNMTLFVQRIERGIEELKKQSGVDSENIAVIGYCFGGTGIIQLAFSGNDEVKVVVSFHGGLTTLPMPETNVTPYTLILSGGDDDAHGNQTELEAALNDGNADWEITRYSGVDHGFTVWGAGAYSLTADYRSWESMLTALSKLMAAPMKAIGTVAPTQSPTEEGTDSAEKISSCSVSGFLGIILCVLCRVELFGFNLGSFLGICS